MALREIGAKLTIEGEQEWNRQMKAVDREIKNLKSEMAASSAEFNGQANTMDALRAKQDVLQRQYSQQTAKVYALREAVASAKISWGENSEQVDKATQSLNYAIAAQTRIGNEIAETNDYLKEAEAAADGCATSIDGYGKKVKAAAAPTERTAEKVEELSDAEKDAQGGASGLIAGLQKLVPQLNAAKLAANLTAAGITAGIGSAFMKTWSWAMNLVDSTAELRQNISNLEIAASAAGMTFDADLTDAIKQVYVAAGDMDTAFKTVNLLLQGGYSGKGMVEVLDELRGAVIAFPDTIKIDSLVEGLQKTLSTGSADGQFKDLLERLGVDVDDFNTKVSKSVTELGRQDVILQTLADSGLAEMTAEYRAASGEAEALRTAEADMQLASARLAESFVPMKARLEETKASWAEFAADLLDAHELGGGVMDMFWVGISSGRAAGDQKGLNTAEIAETLKTAEMSFADLTTEATKAGVSVGEFINQLHADQVAEAAEAAAELAAQQQADAEAAEAAAAAHEAALSDLDDTKASVDDAVATLAELQATYDGIRAGIDSVASGFTDLSTATEQYTTTADDMVAALQSQIDYMTDYAANLQAAKDMGLSDALIEELSDGSAQSAAYLEAIVADGGASIEALNAKFAEVEEGKQAFVDTVAEALPGFTETIDEITATLDGAVGDWNQYAEAYNSGESTIDGLLAGLDRYDEIFAVGQELGQAFTAGYNTAMDIHSPSGVMEKAMDYTLAGALNEGKRRMPDMTAMGEDLGESLLYGFQRASESAAALLRAEAPAAAGDAQRAAQGAESEVVALLKAYLPDIQRVANLQVVLDNGTLVGETAGSMDAELGSRSTLAEKGLAL